MNLYSTNNHHLSVPFKDAIFNSLPHDKGLYMPTHIPHLSDHFIKNMASYSFQQIALEVAGHLLQGAIAHADLKNIIDDTLNFDAPLVPLADDTYVLELFHGPSLAFKDFGARFMSRVMSYYFLANEKKELHILVATSGDTGGAVALGFLDVPNTRVTILFPKGKVSPIQEMQLTTHGKNICAIEVDGTFDDCQTIVKQAFIDTELNKTFCLTSANSINIARLIPQTFYYCYAYAQLQKMGHKDIIFSVPSGNFGNMAAGVLAWKMGLPVKQFLAATNCNDTVPMFLNTGIYQAKPSIQTYSNAMDVGAPSNWVRIMDMFAQNIDAVKAMITGYSFSDEATLQAIDSIYERHQYLVCPHTAIAWLALKKWQEKNKKPVVGIFLATAHPCKFSNIFPERLAPAISIPQEIKALENKKHKAIPMGKDFMKFKNYLLEAVVA